MRDSDMFVRGVSAVADRSETVERRDAHRRGEVAVRAAAGRPLEQLVSEGGGHVASQREKPTDSRRTFQRRPLETASNIQTRAAPCGRNPFRAASTCSASTFVGARTSISARASAATTLGRVPPETTPTLTLIPRVEILQALDRRNLIRELVDGARALAGIDAGVRGNAVDRQLELAAALARGLSAPPGSAGSSTSTARRWLASLSMIVREVPLPISSSVVQSITTGGCRAPVASQRPNGERRDRRFRLSCRTCPGRRDGSVPAQRHPLQRPERPHGVEMTEQQYRPTVAAETRPDDDRRASAWESDRPRRPAPGADPSAPGRSGPPRPCRCSATRAARASR